MNTHTHTTQAPHTHVHTHPPHTAHTVHTHTVPTQHTHTRAHTGTHAHRVWLPCEEGGTGMGRCLGLGNAPLSLQKIGITLTYLKNE